MSKFCAKCGTNLNENDAFCPLCGFATGAKLPAKPIEEKPVQPQEKSQPAATVKAPEPKPAKKKKGGALTVIAIIIAVISSFLSITLFALLLMSSDKTCGDCGKELVCPVCSAVEEPEETSSTEETKPSAEVSTTVPETEKTIEPQTVVISYENGSTYPATTASIEFVINDSYTYDDMKIKAEVTSLEYDAMLVNSVTGYVTLTVTANPSITDYLKEDNKYARVAYKAYDADGNIVRDSFVQGSINPKESVNVAENCPFDLPEEAVKVVFGDYVENN